MADPQGELLGLPPGYGTPSRALPWDEVRARLEEAPHYWLATTCPCELVRPAADTADRSVQASKRKYGYAPPAAAYAEGSGACGLGR